MRKGAFYLLRRFNASDFPQFCLLESLQGTGCGVTRQRSPLPNHVRSYPVAPCRASTMPCFKTTSKLGLVPALRTVTSAFKGWRARARSICRVSALSRWRFLPTIGRVDIRMRWTRTDDPGLWQSGLVAGANKKELLDKTSSFYGNKLSSIRYGSWTVSLPARVPIAPHTPHGLRCVVGPGGSALRLPQSMLSVKNRTEPSAIVPWTPPGCELITE
jgi:hypothetical protein